ncbi:MAG TPA: DNA-processing protein DprA [Hyphomicrobiales bacterium]|nr:DNA-processing protein DprA [Kaistiaceae bacterium]HQF30469.1 DNA-processing protein DprA [Hyphomicrobiales bacterium]
MTRPAAGSNTTGITLSDNQRLNWLRLIRSENVGPATFRDLVNHFGTAEAALAALPELSRRGGASRRIRVSPIEDAEREMVAAARAGARFVALGEADYPAPLRHIDGPPPLIAVRGSTAAFAAPMVAIVGSRNCSIAGRKMATILATGLGDAGFVVVSGLARGIDTAAHEASVASGTIAVFAGGIDRLYPPENGPLLERIVAAGGAAISEMPFGWSPRGRDFPRRNRLISGLSLGVVVIEAATRSGSLITARLALEQNREVFAVPGSPLDPRCEGSNRLIKRGAALVTEARDIIDILKPLVGDLFGRPFDGEAREPIEERPGTVAAEPAENDRGRILAALGPTPVEIDEIVRHTGLALQTVYLVLLELDLAGRLERHPGGKVSLTG